MNDGTINTAFSWRNGARRVVVASPAESSYAIQRDNGGDASKNSTEGD
jgi:hypothetical protein